MSQEEVAGYRVSIRYKNGDAETIYAREFGIDIDQVENSSTLHRFSYKNAHGSETYIYLTPDEVAGITLHPTIFQA